MGQGQRSQPAAVLEEPRRQWAFVFCPDRKIKHNAVGYSFLGGAPKAKVPLICDIHGTAQLQEWKKLVFKKK